MKLTPTDLPSMNPVTSRDDKAAIAELEDDASDATALEIADIVDVDESFELMSVMTTALSAPEGRYMLILYETTPFASIPVTVTVEPSGRAPSASRVAAIAFSKYSEASVTSVSVKPERLVVSCPSLVTLAMVMGSLTVPAVFDATVTPDNELIADEVSVVEPAVLDETVTPDKAFAIAGLDDVEDADEATAVVIAASVEVSARDVLMEETAVLPAAEESTSMVIMYATFPFSMPVTVTIAPSGKLVPRDWTMASLK